MRGTSDLMRIKRKPFFVVLFIFILAIVTPVLADYLGPNRTVTETISVCKVVLYECQYVPARDLWKYKPVDDWSCSNEGKPWQGYENYNGECGLFSKGRTQWGKQEKLQTVTTTQPEATISSALQGCNLNNGWCNTASDLSLTGTEPLSGYSILAVEGTLNGQSFACSGDNCAVPLNEGDNDFTFWALSSWGDSSQMGTFTAKVDTVSPTLGLDIMATGGSNGWYFSSTSLTAIGSDSTSGLSSVFLSVDNGAWQSSTTLNEGVYSVIVQAEDNAGNVSQSSTAISVDTTTPTIDVSVNGTLSNNGWYSSSMEVSATANDATSGVGSLESSLDGGVYQTYISPVSFADGYHTVQFKAMDKAGNETETFVQEFYVDTIAPAVDLPAEWEVNDTITYKVQDDGSRLSALRIVIEDEDEKFAKVAWDEPVSGDKFKSEIMWNGKFKDGTVAPAGEYLVWIKTSDIAGNESIGLGRVTVPQPFASFSLIQPSKSSTEIPTPPADLFVPKDTSPTTENFNPIPSSSTSFGGSTSPTNSTSVQSRTLSSGTASASTTTSTNVLWGATAAALIGWATATALEEKKKRKEQEQTQAAQMKAEVDAFNEAQEAKRIAEMKQWKINSWLEGQAILNAQIEQLEQQGAAPKEIDALKEKAKTEGLGVARNEANVLDAELMEQKMQEAAQADMTEQEKWLAYTSTPEYQARQERLAEWQAQQETEYPFAGAFTGGGMGMLQQSSATKVWAKPALQEPEDCGFLGYKCWRITKWVTELFSPKTPAITPTPVLPTSQVVVTHAPTNTPTLTPVPFNYLGSKVVLIANEMLENQNRGIPLPQYFNTFKPPQTHCTEYVSEVQRRAGIPIQGVFDERNTVSFRTPINQRYNSELNGEFRFRLNPDIHPSKLSNDTQLVSTLIHEMYNSNPNVFVPGATIYTKAPDFLMVYGKDGKTKIDSYLNDKGIFGHSAMIVEQFGSNGPVIHEMSGPNSYVQNNGIYTGDWEGNWSYTWETVLDLEHRIITRGLFEHVPNLTIINNNPAGFTTSNTILTELSIVPAQPILPTQLQNYGLNFEISQNTQVVFSEVVDQGTGEIIDKTCYLNPDTADSVVQQLYCPPGEQP